MGARMTHGDEVLLRIGDIAARVGVSTRTLRYYQEFGLLEPTGSSPGGNRLYSEDDVTRLARIVELRQVMGFDLDQIREMLHSEDRLTQMRAEAQKGVSADRRRELVAEAIEINGRMQERVREKLRVLNGFLTELEANELRYRDVAREVGLDLEPNPSTAG
jgi:MerR family transcriptional regulator, repressor of the yfmOP operon